MDHTGARRPWRKTRKRVGADRERPYLGLGEFLAKLRESIGLSQHELAEKSLWTKHPFDRTYIARIENGETADTAAKFLTYIALLQAHPETVVELIERSTRDEAIEEDLPLPDYYARAKRACLGGAHAEAAAHALAGLSKAREVKDPEWEIRLQIAASIIFKSQNAFSIARSFAEEVLASESASIENRARAGILLAGISVQLGQVHAARAFMQAIDPTTIDADQGLYADYLFETASVAAALGDLESASCGFRQVAERTNRNGDSQRLARTTYRLARIALERQEFTAAHDLAHEALAIARRESTEVLVGLIYLVLGRACTLRGQLNEAREWLLAAEMLAGRLGDGLMQLESRAFLMDLTHRTADRQLFDSMKQQVNQGLRSERVTPTLRKQIDTLLAAVAKRGGHAGPDLRRP